MLVAQTPNGRIFATKEFKNHKRNKDNKIVGYINSKGEIATCPGCDNPVQPKLGKTVIHHWSHWSGECNSESEPETEWHRKWKSYLPADNIEVGFENNRADIITLGGIVCELQHSGISIDKIQQRNTAYKKGTIYQGDKVLTENMFWLFDATHLKFEDVFESKVEFTKGKFFIQSRWKNPRKNWLAAKRGHLLLDFGGTILYLVYHPPKWSSQNGYCLVYGFTISHQEFIDEFLLGDKYLKLFKSYCHYLESLIKNPVSKLDKCIVCKKVSYEDMHRCSECQKISCLNCCDQCTHCNRTKCNKHFLHKGKCYLCRDICDLCRVVAGHAKCIDCGWELCDGLELSYEHSKCSVCKDSLCEDCPVYCVICEQYCCQNCGSEKKSGKSYFDGFGDEYIIPPICNDCWCIECDLELYDCPHDPRLKRKPVVEEQIDYGFGEF